MQCRPCCHDVGWGRICTSVLASLMSKLQTSTHSVCSVHHIHNNQNSCTVCNWDLMHSTAARCVAGSVLALVGTVLYSTVQCALTAFWTAMQRFSAKQTTSSSLQLPHADEMNHSLNSCSDAGLPQLSHGAGVPAAAQTQASRSCRMVKAFLQQLRRRPPAAVAWCRRSCSSSDAGLPQLSHGAGVSAAALRKSNLPSLHKERVLVPASRKG
jgi:hypothetical protein